MLVIYESAEILYFRRNMIPILYYSMKLYLFHDEKKTLPNIIFPIYLAIAPGFIVLIDIISLRFSLKT